MKPVYYNGIEFQMDKEGNVYFQPTPTIIKPVDKRIPKKHWWQKDKWITIMKEFNYFVPYYLIEDSPFRFIGDDGRMKVWFIKNIGERAEFDLGDIMNHFYGENWKERIKC